MVRRAASKHIGAFAQAAEKEAVMSELLSIFTTLAGDEQDSVRLLAIENCTALAKVLNQDENRKHILPLVHSCAEDKSWRVRNNVAREFYQVCVRQSSPHFSLTSHQTRPVNYVGPLNDGIQKRCSL